MDHMLRLRVTSAADIAEWIRMLEFVAESGELPPFDAGSHIEFRTGNGLLRCYSLANDPAERHRYVVAVLREGDGSGWMHGVTLGAVVEASVPRNGFALDETASFHLLLAGGIGITPLRAMAYRLRAIGAPFLLVYCTRTPTATAFAGDLVAEFGDAVTLHHDEGDRARSLDLRALLAERAPGAHLYVCGPRGMIHAACAAAAHWPQDALHYEIFASPTVHSHGATPALHETADFAFEVELRRSGKVITVGANETILDAILAAGIKAPHLCNEGWCGNCQCTLLEGRADHRDEVLSDEEKEANTAIHICISRAALGERRLVIDR
jgi:ferredoxin-NADP reductase